MATFTHQAYQLTLQTPFACPELPASRARANVVAAFGTVPTSLPGPRQVGGIFEARPGRFLLKLEGVGRYLVEDGTRITIQPAPGADEADLRLFLLSTALTVILLQRGGLLPLHASAVQTPRGAALFAGYSGAGKSTLLAALLRRGYRMLSDDVTPVWLEGGRAMAQPSFPYLKLCGDAAGPLGYNAADLPLIRRDARVDKFGVAVEQFSASASPIHAIYLLVPQNKPDIELKTLDNTQKMQAMLYRTAGMPFVAGLGLRADHFKLVAQLASRVAVKRVYRPRSGGTVETLADALAADWA